MYQVNFYCPFCLKNLTIADHGSPHRRYVEGPGRVMCLYCGRTVMTADLDENGRKGRVREPHEFEAAVELAVQIRKICSMTGKDAQFVLDFINQAKMSLDDVRRLVERIARDEWSFEDDS